MYALVNLPLNPVEFYEGGVGVCLPILVFVLEIMRGINN